MKSWEYLIFLIFGLLIFLLFTQPAHAEGISPVSDGKRSVGQIAANTGSGSRGIPTGSSGQVLQVQGCCTHLGQQVMCPQDLPPGSSSVDVVPGGTQWVKPSGAKVFVPSTKFSPCPPTPLSSTPLPAEKPQAPLTTGSPADKPQVKSATNLPTVEKQPLPPSQAPTALPRPLQKPFQPSPRSGSFGNLPGREETYQPVVPASPPPEEGKDLDRSIKNLGDLIRRQEQPAEAPLPRQISGETSQEKSGGSAGQVSEIPSHPAVSAPKVIEPSGGKTVPKASLKIEKGKKIYRKESPSAGIPSGKLPGKGLPGPEDYEAAKASGETETTSKPEANIIENQDKWLKAQGEEPQAREELSTAPSAPVIIAKDVVALQLAGFDEPESKRQEKLLLAVLPSLAGLWVYLWLTRLTGPKSALGAGIKLDLGVLRRKDNG